MTLLAAILLLPLLASAQLLHFSEEPSIRLSGHSVRKARLNTERGTIRSPYDFLVVEPKEKAESVVFLIHGATGKAEQLLPAVEPLQAAGLNKTRFILPQAPSRYLQLFNGSFPSWFNLRRNKKGFIVATSEEEVMEAAQNIDAMIENQVRSLGISRNKAILVGHSQGGALSLTAYLRHRIGGCIGLATFLPVPKSYPEKLTAASKNAPALLLHGVEDKIVLVKQARKSQKRIRRLGRKVTYIEFTGADHSLSSSFEEVGTQMFSFLQKNL